LADISEDPFRDVSIEGLKEDLMMVAFERGFEGIEDR
jgi:hypothetical protein